MTAQPLSRRRLVAGLAVAPALPVAALASPNPDATLLALKARYDAADAAFNRACLAANEAAEAAQVPPFPDTLFVQNGDRQLGLLNYAGEARPDGRRMYHVEPQNSKVRRLRRSMWKYHERIATEADGVPIGDTIARRVPWPEAQARADEIVAAWDGWLVDMGRAHDACGFTAAQAEADRAGDTLREIADALESSAPRTLAGLVALADYVRMVQADSGDGDVLGGFLVRAILGFAGGQSCT